jgi:predicted transcriptional regulator
MRLNLTLDDDHSAKLAELAERTHVQPGTLARSMLLTALDQVTQPSSASLVQVLDGIDGALDRAYRGSEDAKQGRVVPLSDL